MAIIHIKKGEARALKAGGSWIYDNEIEYTDGECEDGDIVTVLDFDDYPLGYGFINFASKIRVRMLSRYREEKPDEEFLRMRVRNAYDYRLGVLSEEDMDACRLIFGEADFLPGLVVDKYASYLVVESLALGIDKRKQIILDELIRLLYADGHEISAVFERSDAPVRRKEGMTPFKGLLWVNPSMAQAGKDEYSSALVMAQAGKKDDSNALIMEGAGDKPPGFWLPQEDLDRQISQEGRAEIFAKYQFSPKIEIIENQVHYIVDVEIGQKTGFFLDQKYNRLSMQQIVRGALSSKQNLGGKGTLKCLDCFTHMGTFALNMGLAGATDVTGLDISEFAVGQATENAALNGLSDQVRFRTANVLDELPKLIAAGELYDIVVVDPPAFTKSREATKNAIKGYREINMKGMKLVRDGGYFATCSCSHFMTEELLKKTIREAAKAVHKRLRQIEFRTQAPDHPILWAADESYYLKFLIFQVVEEK